MVRAGVYYIVESQAADAALHYWPQAEEIKTHFLVRVFISLNSWEGVSVWLKEDVSFLDRSTTRSGSVSTGQITF